MIHALLTYAVMVLAARLKVQQRVKQPLSLIIIVSAARKMLGQHSLGLALYEGREGRGLRNGERGMKDECNVLSFLA